ncbi:MAG: superoxide dismutase family protein [Clostridia bacterium]|nr:superoxide dismutase family protein [Clostridia bacterium]MDD4376377.1 superoxide dismutase family protein [Clostridia bacterium]
MKKRIIREKKPLTMLFAVADIRGGEKYPDIKGKAKFYSLRNGVFISIEIENLPRENKNNFFGLHIHEGNICGEGKGDNPFSEAGGHHNLEGDKHPQHTGDLPMIYSNNGYAYMEFYTDRYEAKDILNNTIIVHENMDDLKTEPAGNSGERIACGEIKVSQ